MSILDFAIFGDDKSFKEAYNQKILLRYYRRKVKKRSLNLNRAECIEKYGDSEFIHLNVHTKFSPLSGVDEPSDVFENAKLLNIKALGVAELGYMSSIPDCHLSSKSSKVKFIAGLTAYFSDYEIKRREFTSPIIEKDEDGNEIEKTDNKIKDHPFLINACSKQKTPVITLLAKNEAGYKELLNLNILSWSDGYYYTPRITRKMLEKFNNGNIVILSGTLLEKMVELGYTKGIEYPEYGALCAYDYMRWFDEKFGDDFYVELTMRCQDTVWGSDLDRMGTLVSLLDSYKDEFGKSLKCVVTNDVYYIDRKDEYLYKAMLAIQRNTTMRGIKDYSSELYLKNRAELRATYNECSYNKIIDKDFFEKACDMTLTISDKCNQFKADTKPKLPHVDNAAVELKKLVAKALIDRGLFKNPTKYEVDGKMVTYSEQAKIELDRFIEKGFESYFLIMRDIIKFSHDSGWMTGPSRGSAGGSLVCFLLGITNSMDPLKFGLSFDRFLSKSRGGNMLNISMDK